MGTKASQCKRKGIGNLPTAEQNVSRQGRRLCPEVTRSGTTCPARGKPPRAGQVLGTPTRQARTDKNTPFSHEKSAV